MGATSIYKGQRLTSATAYLANAPPNLTIIPDTLVSNVLFDGNKAIGVRAISGACFYGSKEVIISGGAINTPQLLLLSGIGPVEELQKHSIPVIKDLPMVGNNLQDHCFASIGIAVKSEGEPEIRQSPSPMGWAKLPSILESVEYRNLPLETREFLLKTTTPIFEICTVSTYPSIDTIRLLTNLNEAYASRFSFIHC
jgi:choline dehydrogenase-like flavoprotein